MACLVYWIFASCAFQAFWAASAANSNDTDRSSLLAFKMEVTGPSQVFDTWNDSVQFCFWSGITCGRKHRRVTAINLSSIGLVGTLTAHLANLTFLRHIDLGGNMLHGQIPSELGRLHRLRHLALLNNSFEGAIPVNISNCLQLVYINLKRNKLVGGIPAELGLLPKLQYLSLRNNYNLGGLIPPSLSNLSSTTFLSLDNCLLEGPIPEEIGQLSQLQVLHLSQNQLKGEIPPSFYNLSNMEEFNMQINNLTGTLPGRIDVSFPHLSFFSVGTNSLTGTIPHWLFNSSSLSFLFLIENSFFGSIPAEIGKLQRLVHLKLEANLLGGEGGDDLQFLTSLTNCSILRKLGVSENNLHGLLPHSIANLSVNLLQIALGANSMHGTIHPDIANLVNLKMFCLEYNLLTGPIPDSIGKMNKLDLLSLQNNQLTGDLNFLGNLTSVVEVDLSINHFHGFIPSSIANCAKLLFLNLRNDSLIGTIPASIAECKNLQYLDLSINNLTDAIPDSLYSLLTLVRLYLHQNSLSGHLSEDIGKLVNVNVMHMYENQLSGPIPGSLKDCLQMELLLLQSNSFDGGIPLSLGEMKVMKKVDLSHNKLTGAIPDVFSKLNYLEFINLSYNEFEGEVPKDGVFRNKSRFSLLENPKLCGGIQEIHLPPCIKDVNDSHKRAKKVKLIVILSVTGCLVFIVALYVALLFCRKKLKRKIPPRTSSSNLQMKMISYREIRNATNGFSSSNLLGTGSFGTVYKGIMDSDQSVVAVKVLNLEQTGATKSFIAECEALRNIRHRNLVKILTVCSGYDYQMKDFKALVFEFMANGTVESWLHPQSNKMDCSQHLNLRKRLEIAIDVAEALDYLHFHCETPVVHCDLKPSNILLDGDLVAHVSDFGLAKFLHSTTDNAKQQHSSTSRLKGTIGYIPPEYGIGSEVTIQGDVFSYGIILLEMLTGKKPTHEMFKDGMSISRYAIMAFPEQVMEIVDPQLLPTQGEYGVEKVRDCLISVMKVGIKCTSEIPDDRISIDTVKSELEHAREKLLGGELAV